MAKGSRSTEAEKRAVRDGVVTDELPPWVPKDLAARRVAAARRSSAVKRAWLVLGAAALLSGGVVLGLVLGHRKDTTSQSLTVPTVSTTASAGSASSPAASSSVSSAASATSSTSAVPRSSTTAVPPPPVAGDTTPSVATGGAVSPGSSVATGAAGAAESASTLPPRAGVYTQGKVYLTGAVPDQATSDAIAERAGAIVGPANVVNQFVVDPRANASDTGSLLVADAILFPSGSEVIAPEFRGILDLGVKLMAQNPKLTITVLGYTDNLGDDTYNLALSQRRADAVVAYLTAKGVDPSRLQSIGKGSADPKADNATAAGRKVNRRIEFVLVHLLDS